ncbi:hypothetical protein [Streptomyces sp. bgisy022]|uniref:hypothetical protein n=1 Tax=Streptomyces sp. bgisy022 TaxID=3413769 RepID=UPI003D751966
MRPWSTSTEDGLRLLLDEWDPVGVADEAPDEYDCLLAPLLHRLGSGADEEQIGRFLRHELEDHFGLDPQALRPEAMAGRVMAWWAAHRSTDAVSRA